jgi:hypothetical protein
LILFSAATSQQSMTLLGEIWRKRLPFMIVALFAIGSYSAYAKGRVKVKETRSNFTTRLWVDISYCATRREDLSLFAFVIDQPDGLLLRRFLF